MATEASIEPQHVVSQRRSHAAALPLLAAVFAFHFLDRQLLAILIPPIKAELALSDTALGLLSGFVFTVFFSVVGLAVGRLADRMDRTRIIAASLAFFSIMTALCGLAANFWQLLAARVGVGVGEGGTNPASHALIADVAPSERRAAAMAAYGVGPHLGLVLAFGVGGVLAQAVGWRATFLIAGAAGVVLALVVRLALSDPRPASRGVAIDAPSPAATLRTLLSSRVLRHLVIASSLATAAGLGLLTWLPALLTRVFGLTLAQAGLALALAFGVAGAVATLAFGRLADRAGARGKPRLLAAWQLALAAVWAVGLLAADARLALAAILLACVGTGAYVGPSLAMVQDAVDPRTRAFSAAVVLLVVNLVGASLGPLAVGIVSDAMAVMAGPDSLRIGLLAMPVLLAWSGWHYARGGGR